MIKLTGYMYLALPLYRVPLGRVASVNTVGISSCCLANCCMGTAYCRCMGRCYCTEARYNVHVLYMCDCLRCAVVLCLVVCLTLLASFFLHSHLSLKTCTAYMYTYMYMYSYPMALRLVWLPRIQSTHYLHILISFLKSSVEHCKHHDYTLVIDTSYACYTHTCTCTSLFLRTTIVSYIYERCRAMRNDALGYIAVCV